jgi:hypothetical protein
MEAMMAATRSVLKFFLFKHNLLYPISIYLTIYLRLSNVKKDSPKKTGIDRIVLLMVKNPAGEDPGIG